MSGPIFLAYNLVLSELDFDDLFQKPSWYFTTMPSRASAQRYQTFQLPGSIQSVLVSRRDSAPPEPDTPIALYRQESNDLAEDICNHRELPQNDDQREASGRGYPSFMPWRHFVDREPEGHGTLIILDLLMHNLRRYTSLHMLSCRQALLTLAHPACLHDQRLSTSNICIAA